MSNDEAPRTIHAKEAMDRAKILSKATWAKFCRRHGIPPNKPGGKRPYLVDDIDRAILAEASIKTGTVLAARELDNDGYEPACIRSA